MNHPSRGIDARAVAAQARIDREAAEIRELLDARMPSTAEWLREDPSIGSVLRVVLRDIIECEDDHGRAIRVLAWVTYIRDLDPR